MTGLTAESELHFGSQALKHNPELLGGAACIRPGDAEPRPKPGECRADQPRADQITPPAQGALTERILAGVAAVEQPLESASGPGVENPTHDLDDRTHRAAAAPELRRHAGGRRPVAELDPDDRHVLERLAAGVVGHPLAVPDLVATSAPRRPAPGALKPSLARQSAHIILFAIDDGDVDGERRRQYTDRSACAASLAPTSVATARLRCGFELRVRFRTTKLSPQRLFCAISLETTAGIQAAQTAGLQPALHWGLLV